MTKRVDHTDHRRRATVRSTAPGAGAMPRLRSSRRPLGRSVDHFVVAALVVAMTAPALAALATATASSAQDEGGFGLPVEGTAVESAQTPEDAVLEYTAPSGGALPEGAPETTIIGSERTVPPASMTTAPAGENAESTAPHGADQYGEPTRLAETGGLGLLGAGAALLAGAAALTYAVFACRSRETTRPEDPRGGDDDALPRA